MTTTFNPILVPERQIEYKGLEGRASAVTMRQDEKPGCFCKQELYFSSPHSEGHITVTVRFDDDCRNGHNTFSVTGEIRSLDRRLRDPILSWGCIHEDIAKYFPALAPLIKWHLCSTDGPMHYIANTCYLASDLDHYGRAAGEPSSYSSVVRFGVPKSVVDAMKAAFDTMLMARQSLDGTRGFQALTRTLNAIERSEIFNPIDHKLGSAFWAWLKDADPAYDFEVLAIEHGPDATGYKFKPKYTFGGFANQWHECPFNTEREALDFLQALQTCSPTFDRVPTAWSEGKARDLDGARQAAIWPDVPDEELCRPRNELEEALRARLPALMAEFRADIEALGLLWERTEA